MSDSRTADKFVIRLPDGLRDQYRDRAAASGRSMNAEMVVVLQTALENLSVEDRLAHTEELLEQVL